MKENDKKFPTLKFRFSLKRKKVNQTQFSISACFVSFEIVIFSVLHWDADQPVHLWTRSRDQRDWIVNNRFFVIFQFLIRIYCEDKHVETRPSFHTEIEHFVSITKDFWPQTFVQTKIFSFVTIFKLSKPKIDDTDDEKTKVFLELKYHGGTKRNLLKTVKLLTSKVQFILIDPEKNSFSDCFNLEIFVLVDGRIGSKGKNFDVRFSRQLLLIRRKKRLKLREKKRRSIEEKKKWKKAMAKIS